MTLAHQVAGWLGLPPAAEQLGFLLSVLVAFALGWTCKVLRDERRRRRREEAFWRGVKLERVP